MSFSFDTPRQWGPSVPGREPSFRFGPNGTVIENELPPLPSFKIYPKQKYIYAPAKLRGTNQPWPEGLEVPDWGQNSYQIKNTNLVDDDDYEVEIKGPIYPSNQNYRAYRTGKKQRPKPYNLDHLLPR